MSKYRCNDVMNGDRLFHVDYQQAADLAGWKPIKCELPPGHKGEHMGRNKFAQFTWWNKEANPQKEEK